MKNNGVLFWKLERERCVRLAVSEQDGFPGNRPFFVAAAQRAAPRSWNRKPLWTGAAKKQEHEWEIY